MQPMIDSTDAINDQWHDGLLSRADVCDAVLRLIERDPSEVTVSAVIDGIADDVRADVAEYLRSLSTARAEEVFWIGGGGYAMAPINPATIPALAAYFDTLAGK